MKEGGNYKKIKPQDMLENIPDEIIDMDVSGLKDFLTLEAWRQLKDTGIYIPVYKLSINNNHQALCVLYCVVEKKKLQWRCGACTTIKFANMVMCSACQSWFHW